MQRDLQYIRDIVTSGKAALRYVADCELPAFIADDEKQHACISRLEIIGEAARRISATTKAKYDLPWAEMVAMRNMLIHEYSKVDPIVIWQTLLNDIPDLLNMIEIAFPEIDGET